MIVLVSCITLTTTTITLFVCSRNNHAPPEWTFGDATNGTGWQSEGLAFLLAICNAVYAFLGTDCGAHICEEIHDPTRNTPKVILYPILIGLLTAFPFAAACMNAITNIDAVLNSPTGVPLIQIYYQSTGSKAASSILLALFAFCFFGCTVGNGKFIASTDDSGSLISCFSGTTCSRTIWAVSRDDMLPFSRVWAIVNTHFKIPLNALCLTGTVVSVSLCHFMRLGYS